MMKIDIQEVKQGLAIEKQKKLQQEVTVTNKSFVV